MALLSVGVLAGFTAVPVHAVSADCDPDFFIDENVDTRSLGQGESEVGQSNVSALSDEELKIVLTTNGDKLEFGIFEMDDENCERSRNVDDDCDQDVVLDTTGGLSVAQIVCTLESHPINDRAFFVVLENLQTTDSLTYEISSS